jgi:ribosome-associated heat shock protein Hsp15
MDKWLWAARFFKTRALAARACELGRIQSNGQQAKAAREVRIGDLLRVTNDGGDFQVEVLLLSEARGPATVAQTLYRETEASRELRQKLSQQRKSMMNFIPAPEGRPSKRDRRKSSNSGVERELCTSCRIPRIFREVIFNFQISDHSP